jgi:hypothetical protein
MVSGGLVCLRLFIGLVRPWGSHLHPFNKNLDLFRRKFLIRGHLQAGSLNRFDQETLCRLAGDNRGTTLSACEHPVPAVQTQARPLLLIPMAADTFRKKERPDRRFKEVELFRSESGLRILCPDKCTGRDQPAEADQAQLTGTGNGQGDLPKKEQVPWNSFRNGSIAQWRWRP